MTEHNHILRAIDCSLTFPNGGQDLHVLDRISLEVASGEFLSVVGPSGCGKTTLLRVLAGLLMPTNGEVVFSGETLQHPRRRIGFVFQQANLMPWRTVRENISLPLELQGTQSAEIGKRGAELIELVGLQGFEGSYPDDLSGGMAQRVAIARALIHHPELLLLDEPLGSLDALTRERMRDELLRIWSANPVTVIMVTHSITEALFLADRVIVLSDRPAKVVDQVEVPFPRPRSLEMTYSNEFGALSGRIRHSLAQDH